MKEEHDLAKWLEGTMTEAERLSFERTSEFADYDRIRKYSAQLKGPDFNTDAMYQNVIHTPKAKTAQTKKSNTWLRVAAILVIGLGLVFAARNATQTQTTANGATQTFVLPDDSQVSLNAGSEIEYKRWNWTSNRTLQLDGEAFFKVAKGNTFDVCTDLGKVTVVGTQFNVKARGDRFEVVCYEGKVRVQSGENTALLTPGMSVTFENGKPMNSLPNTTNGPLWMQDQLSFNAEDLDAVIAELQRQYDIAIIKQNISASEKFTGTIPANNLDVALQIISSTYQLKYKKTEKNSVTLIGK